MSLFKSFIFTSNNSQKTRVSANILGGENRLSLRVSRKTDRFFPPLRSLAFFLVITVWPSDALLSVSFLLPLLLLLLFSPPRFVLFTAGNGDGHTLKDDDNAASSEENATGTTEKIRKSEEQDKERCKLQTLEYVRGREQEGSNLAELTHRPGGAREASQNPQTKEKIGVVERRKHSKEQADEDDGDETQTEVSFEGSGVEVEGVDDMEQRGERQGVLGMQEELALFAEYKEYGGPRMGGVDTMLEGDGVGHTLGGEPARRSAQRTTPAQQLGEPSEEVGARERATSTLKLSS